MVPYRDNTHGGEAEQNAPPCRRAAWAAWAAWAATALALAAPAQAQHTDDNAVTSAEDAFGTVVGREGIGIYNDGSVRGFSPGTAGNFRIEGMYVDLEGCCSSHMIDGETIRVGPAAQGYAFPAPTGIADLTLRSSGEKLIVSPTISADSRGGLSDELDVAMPLAAGLTTAIGAGAYHNRYGNGGGSDRWNVAVVPRWKPAGNVELIAFYNREQTTGDTAQGTYEPVLEEIPPRVPSAVFPGPAWARSDYYNEAFGLVARAKLADWTLRGGLFRSLNHGNASFSNNITINPDGSSGRNVDIYPWGESSSWSGELRASRVVKEGPRKHLFTLALRGRDVLTTYGNADHGNTVVATGPSDVPPGAVVDFPEPSLAGQFAPLTANRTHQATLGLSYGLNWQGVGEVSLGAQRTRYIKDVATPCAGSPDPAACAPIADIHKVTNLWLPALTAAAPLAKGLSAYASFVKGLEDAGTAPSYAANANQLLPAIRSRQWDAGVKWQIAKQSSLIVGYYDIAKPYFNLDTANLYRILGTETHRGVEISLTTSPSKGLTIVGGAILSRPQVTAAANAGEPVGSHPVNLPDDYVQLNVNYDLRFAKGVTLDATLEGFTREAATVDNLVFQQARAHLALGARYKFKLAGKPVTFRLAAYNLTNEFHYIPIASNTYVYNGSRHIEAYITADL